MTEGATPFETRLGHCFRDPQLLLRALTHASTAGGVGAAKTNERLEFLGDRVLGLCMAEWLSELYPHETEGDLGKRFGLLVSREVIAPIAERMGLGDALRLPPSQRQGSLRGNASVLADALEAVLAALYLDGGLPAARAVIEREWRTALDGQTRPPRSPKSVLQELTLKRGLGLPAYITISVGGEGAGERFEATVIAAGREARGLGANKRAAEQAAAEAWLTGITT